MKNINKLHDESMNRAELALIARVRGEKETAQRLFGESLQLAMEAIELIEQLPYSEPNYSVLHRSAATLALDCNEPRLAEKLISKALAQEPPAEIAKELRDLLEQVHFRRHLELPGLTLAEADIKKAFDSACRSLARRAHSRQEISDKLDAKGYEERIISEVLERLTILGYLDDALFAQRWATLKAQNSHWSNRRIIASLLEKGIGNIDIDNALRSAREEISEAEAITALLAKKLKHSISQQNKPPFGDYKEKAKLMAYLLRQGFPLSIIKEKVNIETQDEAENYMDETKC